MLAIRRILVPVDFSEPSRKALTWGLALASRLDATLVCAHVIPFPAPVAYEFPVDERYVSEEGIETERRRLVELIDSYGYPVRSHAVVKSGPVDDELLATASEESIDLIVMATHGRRAFQRWFMGSVTERLLRKSPFPLLTLGHLDRAHEIDPSASVQLRKLLYATDLSEVAGRGIETAAAFAEAFDAELDVLHVARPLAFPYGPNIMAAAPDPLEDRKGLLETLTSSVPVALRQNPRVRVELLEGTPYSTILKFAEDAHIDWIILNTQSRSDLDRALLGATAERVVRGAHVPVLSVPPVADPAAIPLLDPAAASEG